ncbi:MAG TPA: sortase [Actinomycetota bacterium]|nr:sortase [Actinomycetota bacterium]
MRGFRWFGNAMLVVGFTVVLFAVYQLIGTSAIANGHQAEARAAFARVEPSQAHEVQPLPSIKGGPLVVARLRIPKLELTKIVVEGTNPADLAYGPGRYRTSVMPGDPGAVAIAGHRTGWGSPFIDLDRLRRGDEIIIEAASGTYRYVVRKTFVVGPGDAWVLEGDRESGNSHRLVLTTCTPRYTSLKRLIVWADQVDPTPVVPDGGEL